VIALTKKKRKENSAENNIGPILSSLPRIATILTFFVSKIYNLQKKIVTAAAWRTLIAMSYNAPT